MQGSTIACPENGKGCFTISGVLWPGGELDLPECITEDRWLQLSSVERTIYNRTFAALESSVRQSGLLRQKNRNTMEAAARRFKTWAPHPCALRID